MITDEQIAILERLAKRWDKLSSRAFERGDLDNANWFAGRAAGIDDALETLTDDER